MNCETCREHLVDYLYGELDERRRKAVEAALSACPECRAELASLQAIRDGWQRTAEVEPPARMRANILREARLAADPGPSDREAAPWWTVVFQPAFAMAAVAVLGVGASIAVVSTGGDGSDAPSMEAVANGPQLDDDGVAPMAALEESPEAEPAMDSMDEATIGRGYAEDEEAEEIDEVATSANQPGAGDDLDDRAPGAPRPATTRGAGGANPDDAARLNLGGSLRADRGGEGASAMPVREPWQSRTLGGSVLDNEGRIVTNAMAPSADPEPEPTPVAQAEAAPVDYDMDRNRDAATGSSALGSLGTGAGGGGASSGSSSGMAAYETERYGGDDGSARGRGTTTATSGSTGAVAAAAPMVEEAEIAGEPASAQRPSRSSSAPAPAPAPTPSPAPTPTEPDAVASVWGAEDDAAGNEQGATYGYGYGDSAESEDSGPVGDSFADETAREARAELGVSPDDHYARGTAAYDRGDYFAAVDDLSSFVAGAAPNDARRAEALYHVGASQLQLGQRDAARSTLERFVALYPGHAWADQARALLDDLDEAPPVEMMRQQNAMPAGEPASNSSIE